jgi:hypothetical protein
MGRFWGVGLGGWVRWERRRRVRERRWEEEEEEAR